jgi:hypothetical protein
MTLQLCLIMLNQNTHMYIYIEPDQIRRLSYRLQYFFISDSVKVKLYNNRLHNATVCFYRTWLLIQVIDQQHRTKML